MAWWGWLLLAWLAFDLVFAIAWTMRARVRERNAIERRFDPDLPAEQAEPAAPAAGEEGDGPVPLPPRPRRSP